MHASRDVMKRRLLTYLLVTMLGLCLVAFPPFLATLELHHQLGDADQDGHQHSANDLCSWVQSHASSSVVDCVPMLVVRSLPVEQAIQQWDNLLSRPLPFDLPARGPPFLLV